MAPKASKPPMKHAPMKDMSPPMEKTKGAAGKAPSKGMPKKGGRY